MKELNALFILFSCMTLGKFSVHAQLYGVSDIPIIQGTDTLLNAYAGGLNTPQFSAIDLNNDDTDDLLVYDRSSKVALTFINNGTTNKVDYVYAPQYMNRFPQGTKNFMLARDYDCDGIKDLFYFNQPIASPGGIGVLKGAYDGNNIIYFTQVVEVLKYSRPGSSFLQNIFVYNSDLPSFADMDGDGDLDMNAFTLDFTFNRNIYYYKNMSAENGYGCDSIQMTLGHQCWGLVSETGTDGAVTMSPSIDSCGGNPNWLPRSIPNLRNRGVPRHTGSTLTALDQNGDGSMDMIMSDVSVNFLNLMSTETINDTLLVNAQDTTFPTYDIPADLFSFPAAYILDVDNDGVKDMIVAPNETFPTAAVTDSVSWWYKNTQSNNDMIFEFQQKDFLVNTMVDLGHKASPAFFDYNADGLLDLIVGNVGYCQPDGSYIFGLHLYENVGTSTEPAFQLISRDYGGLSSLQLYDMHPTFGDLDGDGDEDLLFGESDGNLYYVENSGGAGNAALWGTIVRNYANINSGDKSTPQLVDLNEDGLLDIVTGASNGSISYYENTGTTTNPVFSATPVSQRIGFIDINTMGSGESAPHFVKINDHYELFLGHMQGGLIHMGNIDGNILGVYDTLSMKWEGIYTGYYSKVAAADLDGDDALELVIGNSRGGFGIYSINKDSTVNTRPVAMRTSDSDGWKAELFPNPAQEVLTIRFQQVPKRATHFKIYNSLGQMVKQTLVSQPKHQETLDTHQLNQGVYVLEIQSDLEKLFLKFYIQN